MDDMPGDYSGPDHDSGKGTCDPGTYRFLAITFAVMVGTLLLTAALRRWVFHW